MVKPKKHLGQHFLTDMEIAKRITEAITITPSSVMEVGPGTGVLTQFLTKEYEDFKVVEIDTESVSYLKKNYQGLEIIEGDFLKLPLDEYLKEKSVVIGNFPYNISSQIYFRVLDYKNTIQEVVGMIQKEVADRFAAKHGNKTYGILSVLLQAFYDVEYLFTVDEDVFNPPPKVKSGVIRMTRNNRETLPCSEKLFIQVVKHGFGMRRKTLRNALKSLSLDESFKDHEFMSKRAEQLSVEQFIELSVLIEKSRLCN